MRVYIWLEDLVKNILHMFPFYVKGLGCWGYSDLFWKDELNLWLTITLI